MVLALAAQEQPHDELVLATLVNLLDEVRQAVSLLEINIAAGIAHETLATLLG